jgi:hypothetical protein
VLWHMAPATMTPYIVNVTETIRMKNPYASPLIAVAVRGLDLLLDSVNKGLDNIGNNFPSDHPGAAVAIFDTANAYREVWHTLPTTLSGTTSSGTILPGTSFVCYILV